MLNIPSKLCVGYNSRTDTYSGKLGYVVYYKGKKNSILAKETSFEGWRDKELGKDDFDNVPTEGFVINKRVGGGRSYSYYDHARELKIRVYDPRGFEIEITPENLLFILETYDCYKGKGIDGKFVYAWEGKDLILLPTESQDYQDTLNIQEKIGKANLGARDLVPGRHYTFKRGYSGIHYSVNTEKDTVDNVVYLGRLPWYFNNKEEKVLKEYPSNCSSFNRFSYYYDKRYNCRIDTCYASKPENLHVFYYKDSKTEFIFGTKSPKGAVLYESNADDLTPVEIEDLITKYKKQFEGIDKKIVGIKMLSENIKYDGLNTKYAIKNSSIIEKLRKKISHLCLDPTQHDYLNLGYDNPLYRILKYDCEKFKLYLNGWYQDKPNHFIKVQGTWDVTAEGLPFKAYVNKFTKENYGKPYDDLFEFVSKTDKQQKNEARNAFYKNAVAEGPGEWIFVGDTYYLDDDKHIHKINAFPYDNAYEKIDPINLSELNLLDEYNMDDDIYIIYEDNTVLKTTYSTWHTDISHSSGQIVLN
jgi:hypothetical protein